MGISDILVKVDHLCVDFHSRNSTLTAVEDVSFHLAKGAIIGLVGESGCGKSVACRTLLRIEAPGRIKSGTIQYYKTNENAVNIHELDPKQDAIRSLRWQEIAMIFQEPMISFSPMHTIGNQILEAVNLHDKVSKNEAKDFVTEALRSVGMSQPEQVARQYPHQLSGGMLQRAMIAMALICYPRLLIADEPTTALDVTTAAQIIELLQERQKALNMAILYITHNLAVVSQIAEKVLVMYLGRIVEEATAENLFNAPKHPYTQALIKSMPGINTVAGQRLQAIKGDVPSLSSRPAGCAFHPRCSFVMSGLCNQTVPSMQQLENDTRVSCFLYT